MSFSEEEQMNLPELYWNLTAYRATLTHKVNHSFTKSKTYFGYAMHPRFGLIRSLVAEDDIEKGEEIFANYGYGFHDWVPQWYQDLYQEELGKPWPGL